MADTLISAPSYSLEEMDQKYRNGGMTTAFGKTTITYIEARCVGGGSEINAGFSDRPWPDTLNGWRARYAIDDFGDDPKQSNEGKLEAIQMAWYEEWKEARD